MKEMLRLLFQKLMVLLLLFYSSTSNETYKALKKQVIFNDKSVEKLIYASGLKVLKELGRNIDNFEVFIYYPRKYKLVFKSKYWPNVIFEARTGHGGKVLIFNEKDEGQYKPSEDASTFIVLLESKKNKRFYSAHKVYVRDIDGNKKIEWDIFEIVHKPSYNDFYTAVTPTDYMWYKTSKEVFNITKVINKIKNKKGKIDGKKERRERKKFMKQSRRKNAFTCLFTVVKPPACILFPDKFTNTNINLNDDNNVIPSPNDQTHTLTPLPIISAAINIEDSVENEIKSQNVNSRNKPNKENGSLKSLGQFYNEVEKIHFRKSIALRFANKSLARKLQKDFAKHHIILKSTKNKKMFLFESKKSPFTGNMDCKYEEANYKKIGGLVPGKIVDFYLKTLRAQCHAEIRNHTLGLFNKGLVTLSKNKHNHVIDLKHQSKFMGKLFYTNKEWKEFISAIYLSAYSEAFSERKINLKNSTSHSNTVATLSLFVEKVLKLLKIDQLQRHGVKISKALVKTVTFYREKNEKEAFLLTTKCTDKKIEKECLKQKTENENDYKRLGSLSRYIIRISGSVIMHRKFVGINEFILKHHD